MRAGHGILALVLCVPVASVTSRGSVCEACVGLSARACLDTLGVSLASLGDDSRVAVLETAFAGSDRCDGSGGSSCAARYDELVASAARPARLRRLRAACGATTEVDATASARVAMRVL